MDKLKKALSGDDGQGDEERGIVHQLSDAVTLDWSTRIKGFIICFVIGFLFSVLGSAFIFMPPSGYKLFALFYTLGNIMSLGSTCFLMGPFNQVKKMFAPTRAIATIVMLVSLVLTLLAGLWWKNGMLCLIFVVMQFLAMLWYSISYIPYARDAVKKAIDGCLS